MYTEKELQILMDFAKNLNPKHTHIVPIAGFEEYLVCKTDFMMEHPYAKCGQPKIVTLRNGTPYMLTREDYYELCKKMP